MDHLSMDVGKKGDECFYTRVLLCVNDNNSRCVSQVGGRVHVSKL